MSRGGGWKGTEVRVFLFYSIPLPLPKDVVTGIIVIGIIAALHACS